MTTQTPSPRLPGIDGLRAIAVGLVIVFHLTPGAAIGGYIGVDVFFVISGFLITGLLLREHAESGRIALGQFWRRRARRLLPALITLVLVCASVALAVGGDVLVGIGAQVLGSATFSYNWLAIAGGASYFDETTPELFRNLWSLAVEEQFYLLWPFIVLLLVRLPRAARLVVVVLAAAASALAMLALFASGADATRLYYGTDTHSFGLALGAALAIVAHSWPREELGWSRAARALVPTLGALAVAGIFAIGLGLPTDDDRVYTGGLVVVAALSAIAIAGAIVPGGYLGRVLDLAPLRFIGERSYGLYLWHWPVFVLIVAAVPAAGGDVAGQWMSGAAALAITVVAASLSYRFIEMPIRRRGFRATVRALFSSPRRALALGALATATFVALASLTGVAVVRGQSAGQAQARIEKGQDAIAKPRERSDLPSGKEITAIGDSVMLAAAPEVTRAFPGIDIDAVVSRQMNEAPELVAAKVRSGSMRKILVLSLGTNGPMARSTIDEVKSLLSPTTKLVVVNLHVPRDWNDPNNRVIDEFASEFRSVEVANWHDAIDPHLDVLSSDQIHPGGPKGGRIYARAIRDALQRLADLPPLQQNAPGINDPI